MLEDKVTAVLVGEQVSDATELATREFLDLQSVGGYLYLVEVEELDEDRNDRFLEVFLEVGVFLQVGDDLGNFFKQSSGDRVAVLDLHTKRGTIWWRMGLMTW